MADKRITALTLRDDFDDTCNIPIDDTVQTYRVTGAQVADWIATKGYVSAWSSSVEYAEDDLVFYGPNLYASLQGSNENQNPASVAAYWRSLTGFDLVETRVDATGTGTDGTVLFNFSGLTAGKRYRVFLSASIAIADNNGTLAYLRILHNGTSTVAGTLGTNNTADSATATFHIGTVIDIPSLVGTTVKVDWSETDGSASCSNLVCTLVEVNGLSHTFGT